MFDFAPLYRSSVGFDRLARMLDDAASFEAPPIRPIILNALAKMNIASPLLLQALVLKTLILK